MDTSPLSTRRFIALTLAAAAALASVTSCSRRPPVDPAYRARIDAWRKARVAALTAETGWLSLVGLYWLEPGPNAFGSSADAAVVIPGAAVPPVAGTLDLAADGTVTVHVRPDAAVTMNGEPVSEAVLRSDASGGPDTLRMGDVRFYVIARGGRLAVRVKDPASPTRQNFKGIEYFPVDPAFRVEGTFEPYPEPRQVTVPTAAGTQATTQAPGVVRFTLEGREMTLQAWDEGKDLFFVFRDATSGKQTYGAGRFLDAAPPEPGSRTVVLDFNEAYNPPCAFTPYATCPLPPEENALPVAVTAGEKYSGHH